MPRQLAFAATHAAFRPYARSEHGGSVRAGKRKMQLDARASDAIALALGNEAPIFVSRQVIDRTGVETDSLPPGAPEGPEEIPAHGGGKI